jgi:hypothetical protein
MFVLNEIADDYENLHQITKQVTPLGSACGLTIETSEILQALRDLTTANLARAYRFVPPSNATEEILGMPPTDEIGSPDVSRREDVFFLVTEKGTTRPCGYPTGPDNDRVLRSDWKPPEK